VERARGEVSLDEALTAIDFAQKRDEVGDAIVQFLATRFRVSLVLIAKDGAALGWKGFAPHVDADVLESIAIPLGSASVIRAAHDTKRPWFGPPPADGAAVMSRVYKLLRCEAPRAAAAVPIVVQGRVVNIVYAHGDELPPTKVQELQRISDAARDAYVRIIRARSSVA
jgi:hypothetical protein